jgi:hypothetical protein
VGSRAAAKKNRQQGRSKAASPFFLTDSDCYLYLQQETQKKGHKQLILAFSFFVFQICISHFSFFGPTSCGSVCYGFRLLLLCFGWQVWRL